MKKKIKILNLSTKMIDAHPYGCFSALVKGRKGVGKSTYCIHGSAQVYYILSKLPDSKRYIKLEQDISFEEAYHVALDHLKFKLSDIVDILRESKGALKDSTKMCPCVIWDDAGVYASSSLFKESWQNDAKIKKYNNIVRTRCTGWLINTPMVEGLTKTLRETDDPIIKIVYHNGKKNIDEEDRDKTINKYLRLATAMIKRDRSHWGDTVFKDDFRCRLQYKSVHDRYMDMKEEAFDDVEKQMDNVDV